MVRNVSTEQLTQILALLKPFSERLDLLEAEVKILKAGHVEHEQRIHSLEEARSLTTRITQEQITGQLKLRPTKTDPVFSKSLLAKIQTVKDSLNAGKNVVIVGEGGVGKSILLKAICLALLSEGIELFTFGLSDVPSKGIFVVDDAPGKLSNINPLLQLPCRFLATARTSEWLAFKGNVTTIFEVPVDRNDHDSEGLTKMLTNLLKSRGLTYDEDALNVAVEKSQNLPEYVSSLVSMVYLDPGKRLTSKLATKAPLGILELIAEIVLSLRNETSVAVAYCLSLTHQGRLHNIQLRALESRLRSYAQLTTSSTISTRAELEAILRWDSTMAYLPHDLWKSLLIRGWSAMGISRSESRSLIYIRSLKFDSELFGVLNSSMEEFSKLDKAEVAKVATVIVENNSLEAEMGLLRWLREWNPNSRPALLVGMGGVGKTRAVLSVAHLLSYHVILLDAWRRTKDSTHVKFIMLADGAIGYARVLTPAGPVSPFSFSSIDFEGQKSLLLVDSSSMAEDSVQPGVATNKTIISPLIIETRPDDFERIQGMVQTPWVFNVPLLNGEAVIFAFPYFLGGAFKDIDSEKILSTLGDILKETGSD